VAAAKRAMVSTCTNNARSGPLHIHCHLFASQPTTHKADTEAFGAQKRLPGIVLAHRTKGISVAAGIAAVVVAFMSFNTWQ
jgi:hypothetical protein